MRIILQLMFHQPNQAGGNTKNFMKLLTNGSSGRANCDTDIDSITTINNCINNSARDIANQGSK